MARPKKTTNKKTTTRKAAAKSAYAKANKKKAPTKADVIKAIAKRRSSDPKEQAATIKLLKKAINEKQSPRRPPNNPEVPQNIIDSLNTDLNSIKELLDAFSQHGPKAFGFLVGSLRYAQTPHINSWSFAKSKTPSYPALAG